MIPEKVTLVGGPCDGQVVGFSGMYFAKLFKRFIDDPFSRIFEARYFWEEIGEQIVGRFGGYWRGRSRVDKLGRRLRKRSRQRRR